VDFDLLAGEISILFKPISLAEKSMSEVRGFEYELCASRLCIFAFQLTAHVGLMQGRR
jgi:hypothetical protein